MSAFVQSLLDLIDPAPERIQRLLDRQTCVSHPRTTVGEYPCPLCAIDAAMPRAARARRSTKEAATA